MFEAAADNERVIGCAVRSVLRVPHGAHRSGKSLPRSIAQHLKSEQCRQQLKKKRSPRRAIRVRFFL